MLNSSIDAMGASPVDLDKSYHVTECFGDSRQNQFPQLCAETLDSQGNKPVVVGAFVGVAVVAARRRLGRNLLNMVRPSDQPIT